MAFNKDDSHLRPAKLYLNTGIDAKDNNESSTPLLREKMSELDTKLFGRFARYKKFLCCGQNFIGLSPPLYRQGELLLLLVRPPNGRCIVRKGPLFAPQHSSRTKKKQRLMS